MRLSKFQIQTILDGVEKFCGKDAKVWLFGSRVDDLKKGGDIDLYVEIDPNISILDAKLKLMSFFELKMGEQKIDILIRSTDQPISAMHDVAKSTGQQLNHVNLI